jgi:hypothetical protein
METSIGIAVEEYLRTNYDHDMDYVDGKLVERDVGERNIADCGAFSWHC